MDATPTRLRIDFVSDVVCPWCAVGLMSLERALERTRGEVEAEIHFQPFELNPQMPAEGEDAEGHLQRKYGMSAEQAAANKQVIVDRGAAVGFTFDMARRSRIYNTFDAHRLLHWAEGEGEGLQRALKHALLRAYFSEGRDVSDHDTLAAIAAGAGLPEARAREILGSDAFADEVRIGEQFFQSRGIRAVPAIIFEGRHLVSGGQPPELFEQALRQIAAEKRQAESVDGPATGATHDDPRPVPPEKPLPGDCCGDGCAMCVNDVYEQQLEDYEAALAAWEARNPPAPPNAG